MAIEGLVAFLEIEIGTGIFAHARTHQGERPRKSTRARARARDRGWNERERVPSMERGNVRQRLGKGQRERSCLFSVSFLMCCLNVIFCFSISRPALLR